MTKHTIDCPASTFPCTCGYLNPDEPTRDDLTVFLAFIIMGAAIVGFFYWMITV